MSHLLLTHPQTPHYRAPLRMTFGPMTALIGMMLLVGLLGLLSLTHLNAQSTKGYVINKLEDDQQELQSDREINDMLILQARSMKTIQGNPVVQAMVRPEHVYYLEGVSGLAVAPAN